MIIAEVGQAHDGSLGLAHAFIDAIAKAGADAVKFQTHIAQAESTPVEPWRVKFSHQDKCRYDYWKRMEFTEEQWKALREHAAACGLQFGSSPFSREAACLLRRVGMDFWKVASGEMGNWPLLKFMAETGTPILLSTGMSRLHEIDESVRFLKTFSVPVTILQCTSSYPCPPEHIGLNVIPLFRERYACAVGLSDHSGNCFAGLAAATIGIDALEVHLTLSRDMPGPDVPASVTPEELRQLVEGIRIIEKIMDHPVDKDAMAEQMVPVRRLFMKSVVASVDLPAGTRLAEKHVAFKKPGTGIPPDKVAEVIGRTLRRAVAADTLLSEGDFE
jgi:N-acetylneuraminate synthase